MTGPTMWGQRAVAHACRWVTRPTYDFVEAEHDGYQRLPGRPVHRRSVFHQRGGATFVVDRLLGDGTHTAELNWHLSPETRLERAGPDAWQAAGEGFRLHLALLGDGTLETAVTEGQDTPPQGWVSPRFGEREPARVLSVRRTGPLPLAWVTILMPDLAGRTQPMPGDTGEIGVCGRVDTRGVVAILERSTGQEIFAHSFGETKPHGGPRDERVPEADPALPSSTSLPWLDLGEGRYRGQAAHLRLDDEGRLVECSFVGGLELEWNGQQVWRSAAGGEDTCVVGPLEGVDLTDLPPHAVPAAALQRKVTGTMMRVSDAGVSRAGPAPGGANF